MAARPENVLQGYDVSRFISEVRDDLLCDVCQDVPNNPRCCQNNYHLQTNSHTCPVCKDPLPPSCVEMKDVGWS